VAPSTSKLSWGELYNVRCKLPSSCAKLESLVSSCAPGDRKVDSRRGQALIRLPMQAVSSPTRRGDSESTEDPGKKDTLLSVLQHILIHGLARTLRANRPGPNSTIDKSFYLTVNARVFVSTDRNGRHCPLLSLEQTFIQKVGSRHSHERT
jgi:hypothetical protein